MVDAFMLDDQDKVFIAYLDEDGNKRSGYFFLIQCNNLIVFNTVAGSRITIPSNRLLKIKEVIA